MAADARDAFAQQFRALLAESGLPAKQVVARVNGSRPPDARWSVTSGVLSAWKTGRHLPSKANQDGFFRVVSLLTEHARGRAVRGHPVGELLDEVAWTRMLNQARAAAAATGIPAWGSDSGILANVEVAKAMVKPRNLAGHAFISYVREDSFQVDQLQRTLQAAGIPVWRDTADLWPGEDWRAKIRRAIIDNTLVLIACFSHASLARGKSYQNEELTLAIEQMKLRRPDDPWLIPVRFDECDIPERDIGGGRTLTSIQRADLFGGRSNEGAARLVATVLRILGQQTGVAPASVAESPTPAADSAIHRLEKVDDASAVSNAERKADDILQAARAEAIDLVPEAGLPAEDMPFLRVENSGDIIPLRGEVTTVGSGPGANIRLGDPSVSPLHAELVRRDPYVYVVDLGLSRNGTRVNGRPVARRVLEDGDVFASARPAAGSAGPSRRTSPRKPNCSTRPLPSSPAASSTCSPLYAAPHCPTRRSRCPPPPTRSPPTWW